MANHGYGPYTRGCRCDVCRMAKADYMRARRTKARRKLQTVQSNGAGGYHFVPGITHGIGGYDNFSCRCPDCRSAKRDKDARRGH